MFEEIRKELISMSDKEVAKMTAKVCPDTDINDILGIKIPELRKKAKRIVVSNEFKKYIEELILQGLVIAYSKIDLEQKLDYIKAYVPQINNWLINDTVCSTLKVKKEQEQKML